MRKRFTKRISVALLVVLAIVLLGPIVAFAIMPSSVYVPDVTSMTITSVDNYENYLELGDVLSVVNYNVLYSGFKLPSLTIDKTMIGRYMDTTGAEIANVSPYPYFTSGYQHGIFSFYWPASYGKAWNVADSVRFDGNPLINWLGNGATTAQASYQSDSGGVFTDQTAASNNAAANDMNPLGAVALNDASYFGLSNPFDLIAFQIGTQGSWTGSVTWEYWNGSLWSPVSGLIDNTTGFTEAPGTYNVSWTMPTDWEKTTVNAVGPYYYVRVRVSAFTAVVVVPLGTQSWLNGNNTTPGTSTPTINWHTTSTVAANSTTLGIAVIGWAQTLSNYWNVALTVQGASGNLLSNYGFAYFSNAIPGISTACPQIFTSSSSTIVPVEQTSFDTSSVSSTANLWPWSGASNAAGWLARGWLFWGLMLAVVGIVMKASGRPDLALVCVLPGIAIGAEIGAVSMGTAIILGVICILILGVTFVLQRGNT